MLKSKRCMIYVPLYFWLFCLTAQEHLSGSFRDDLQLVKTIVIFRHGMRAPLNAYEFDEHTKTDQKLWPEGYGTLVNEGKNQMYELGKRLRQRYEKLLIPYGNTLGSDVKMVTTAVDRCYQSGALLLAGFYPPDERQRWNDELLWQPVPIKSSSPDKVHIIGQKHKCPTYNDELLKVYEIKKNDTNVKYLLDFLSNYTHPVKLTTAKNLFYFADYIRSKESLSLKLPYWANVDFLKKLDEFYFDSFSYITYSDKMSKLLSGPLIKDIVHRIQDVVHENPENSKFYFYSGHDSSLVSLFSGLNIKKNFIPTFGAAFIFEVYQSEDKNFLIRILFNYDYSLTHLEVKVLPNCEEYCSMDKFVQLLEKYLNLDWKKECRL